MATLNQPSNAHGPILSREVTVTTPEIPAKYTDPAALKMVTQDIQRAEMWFGAKQWPLHLREIDILYQSPRTLSTFEGSGVTRSNVSRFTVAKHTNTLVPQIMSGIFYDSPPFIIRPRPRTDQKVVRAKTALFAALLEEMEFKQECETGIESQVLNGTGMWFYGWTVTVKKVKKFVRKNVPAQVDMPFEGKRTIHTVESDEFKVEERTVTKSRPFFENCPIGTILMDPGWRTPNRPDKAKYAIRVSYPTFRDLDELRQQEGYDIPTTEFLKNLFFPPAEIAAPDTAIEQQQSANAAIHHAETRDQKTTEDPLAQPLRLDERWDGEKVITLLNGKLIIRNTEHHLGRIPLLSANWWNIQNAGFGLGIGRLVGSDQRVEQGTINAALDILALGVNPQYLRSRGANVLTQQIRSRLGGIIDADGDIEKAFKLLESPKIPPEVWTTIQVAKQAAESNSGADEAFTQGALPQRGGSSVGRTATGAGGIMAASAGRIQGPVGKFCDNVFIPFLYALDEMVSERMPVSEIREILGEEIEDLELKALDMESFLNARFKFEVLAGAHLAAKKAMAQVVPMMIQLLENPHLFDALQRTGWTVDIKELFEMLWEVSEWKNSRAVIRKMTPQESQAYQAAQQGAAMQKVQGDLAKIQATHAAKSEEIDQGAESRLASKLLADSMDRADAYEQRRSMENAEEAAYTGKGKQSFSVQ